MSAQVQTASVQAKRRPWWHWVLLGFVIAIPIAWLTTPEAPPPAVPQEAIDEAIAFIEQELLVRDAAILIEDRQIVLALAVNRAITEQAARQLGENFLRFFSGAVSRWSDDERITRPTRDSYGGLWQHYSAIVVVAFDADTVFQRGTLARGASTIRW